MIKNIFNRHDLQHLKAGMEVSWQERLETSHNIANAETPGFRPQNTDFRSHLMPGATDAPPRGEGFQLYLEAMAIPQEFNLEREIKRLSQSNMENSAYSRILSKRYSDLRNSIREGR